MIERKQNIYACFTARQKCKEQGFSASLCERINVVLRTATKTSCISHCVTFRKCEGTGVVKVAC